MIRPSAFRALAVASVAALAAVAAPPLAAAADPVTVSGVFESSVGPITDGRAQGFGLDHVSTETSPEGAFALELEPGTWRILVTAEVELEAEPYNASYHLYRNLDDVEVVDDMTIDTTMAEDPFTVTLEDSSGDPVGAGVYIECNTSSQGKYLGGHVRVEGTGTLWGLPSTASDPAECALKITHDNGITVYEDIELSDDVDDTFTWVAPDPVPAAGVVTGPDGPLEDVRVTACDFNYSGGEHCFGSARTDRDGSFTIGLPAWGSYDFLVGGDGFEFYLRDVSVTEDAVLEWDFPALDVTVNLVDADGDPATAEASLYCAQDPGPIGGFSPPDTTYAEPREVAGQGTITVITSNDGVWWCEIAFADTTPPVLFLASPGDREVTIQVPDGQLIEADDDGVPDYIEALAPNDGDGNGDGTQDSEQVHVTSLPQYGDDPGVTPYLTVAGPVGSALVDVSTLYPEAPPPVGVSLPAGLVSFVLEGIAAGSTHTVSLYVGSTDGINGYAKYDEDDGWSTLPAGRVQVHPDRVDITLTDGGVGDADGLADGRITDPGGPAIIEVTADSTPPVVTGNPTTDPNANGWYAGNVTVHWTASDESGIATPPPDTVVTGQGANLVAQSASVCDLAPTPNCATGNLPGIRIDRTPPAVTVNGAADGATYTLGAVPATSCQASDPLSGLQGICTVTTSGGNSRGIGSYTVTARAVDRAGNVRTTRVRYQVVYRFDGFLPPINVGPGASMSVFRRGSTVTLAFVLRRANGTVVTPASAPTWLTPQRGARTQANVNEATASLPSTSGSRFVWRNGRWEYTWSTRNTTAGYTYRLGARLDDGTNHTINIGVR